MVAYSGDCAPVRLAARVLGAADAAWRDGQTNNWRQCQLTNFDPSHIRTETEAIAGGVACIADAQHQMARAVSRATRKRPYVNVDALTQSEVDELRAAIAEGSPVKTAQRVADDPALVGMYEELSSLGLVETRMDMDGALCLASVSPLGIWAVEKRELLDAEEVAARERQWRHEREMTWITALAGILGAVIGSILTVALTLWLLP